MERGKGKPLPLGAFVKKDRVNFSVEVPKGKSCELLLYQKHSEKPWKEFQLSKEDAVGDVRFMELTGICPEELEYNYRIGEEIVVDPYAKQLAGTEQFGQVVNIQQHEVRGCLYEDTYEWEEDSCPRIAEQDVIAYSIHVRGFTRHSSSKVKHKGTFRGVVEKIPYMQELGINQIHCMPVYEFWQTPRYVNYWGYGPACYFAPQNGYAASGDGVTELKDMIKACHRAGIEVILEMAFEGGTPRILTEACLRHYVLEYHVDGFLLNPLTAPWDGIYEDPILNGVKILKHQTDFQNVMRRFLKGDEGMVPEVIYWLKKRSQGEGIYNYMTNHNGFTLCDLVSYDAKHNEQNGENNQDGPDYNYSWNCGAEGPSRKKAVMALRKKQMRNAFLLLFLAQGVPCILAGDEFANTQKGNNNVYCQDNPTAWLDWSKLKKEQELFQFVKALIGLRKMHPAFHQEEELKGMDQLSCGVPDISYHGEYAWQTPSEVFSRQLGVYYCGELAGDEDCFAAYNMHWLEHTFALPALAKGKRWYQMADTSQGILEKEIPLENQREVQLEERTIAVFVGR